MKNGLLVYNDIKEIFNIGDYIQSLAAKQFLQEPIIYLNRERLNKYDGEKVSLIMNGWFLHKTENWPPAKTIFPKFISFHLNKLAYQILDRKENIEYFKMNEPIGCRDFNTKEILEDKGIKAYFTGCLTLTLGHRYGKAIERGGIVFADPVFNVDKSIKSLFVTLFDLILRLKIISRISKKMYNHNSLRNIIKTAFFFNQYKGMLSRYQLDSAIYKNHILKTSDFKNEDEKFKYAEELIDLYSQADLVITSRIHCALPCLGLGTKVIYVNNLKQNSSSSSRLKGLLDFFNVVHYSKGKFSSNDIILEQIRDFNFDNKNEHIRYKQELISRCKNLVG